MKNLIILNLVTAGLLAAAVIAFARNESFFFLPYVVLISSFGVLAVANLLAPLFLWKRNGQRSLRVPLSFVVAAIACYAIATLGTRLALAGTPSSPDSFLRGPRQSVLEGIAGRILAQGSANNLPPDVSEKLRAFGFERTRVDNQQRIVTFSYYRLRTWHDYLFTPDSLPEPYSRAPSLIEADVVNWGEIRRIAEQAVPESQRARGSLVFEPSITVPYFEQALGDSFLRSLRTGALPRHVTSEEKALVLATLNQQCSADSRLIERPEITYQGDPPALHIGASAISDGFWVASLLKALLHDGILVRAPDGRHLRFKDGLSALEEHKVAWLHVGLMNFIYGNLIEKSEHLYDRRLGEHWYFRSS